MRRWIPTALLSLLLAGCQMIEPGPPPERIEVIETERESRDEPPPVSSGRMERTVTFPEAEYAALEKRGSAELSGRLSLGGRPAAGQVVSAAPVTTYSAEAAEQALAGRAVEPADPRAREYTHTTRTDRNGRFRIANLPAGEFYVSGAGPDPTSGETRVVIHQISLGNGQRKQIELSR
jgi:hypothetical protein